MLGVGFAVVLLVIIVVMLLGTYINCFLLKSKPSSTEVGRQVKKFESLELVYKNDGKCVEVHQPKGLTTEV